VGVHGGEALWKAALIEDVRRVAWVSRRSASEYSGFLEWLWRLGDLPYEVVEPADMRVGSRYRAFSLALLSRGDRGKRRLEPR
jgi:hypothetical protein